MNADRLSRGHTMVTHYHYHSYTQAPPAPVPVSAPHVVYVRDMGVQTEAPAQPAAQAAPVLPSRPPVRPRPEGRVAGAAYDMHTRWIALWAKMRPGAIWLGKALLIAIDFVLTRVSIGFLFRPVGGA